MDIKSLITIPDREKDILWNKFAHEETLLLDLDIYRKRVKSMDNPVTVLDLAVLTVYKHHVRNIENLLTRLYGNQGKRAAIS